MSWFKTLGRSKFYKDFYKNYKKENPKATSQDVEKAYTELKKTAAKPVYDKLVQLNNDLLAMQKGNKDITLLASILGDVPDLTKLKPELNGKSEEIYKIMGKQTTETYAIKDSKSIKVLQELNTKLTSLKNDLKSFKNKSEKEINEIMKNYMSEMTGLSLVPTYKWQTILLDVPVNDTTKGHIRSQICQIGGTLFDNNFKYHLYQNRESL